MDAPSELYEKGQKVRTEVMGEEHVRKTLAGRQSEFSRPIQIFTTEHAWGKVWSRPELDRRSRSLISMFQLVQLIQGLPGKECVGLYQFTPHVF